MNTARGNLGDRTSRHHDLDPRESIGLGAITQLPAGVGAARPYIAIARQRYAMIKAGGNCSHPTEFL